MRRPHLVVLTLSLGGCFITPGMDEKYRNGTCVLACGATDCTPTLTYAQDDLERCFRDPVTGAWDLPPLLEAACPSPTFGCDLVLPPLRIGGEVRCVEHACTWNAREAASCTDHAREQLIDGYSPAADVAYDVIVELDRACSGLKPEGGWFSATCEAVDDPTILHVHPGDDDEDVCPYMDESAMFAADAGFMIDPALSHLTISDPWHRTSRVALTGKLWATNDGHFVDGVLFGTDALRSTPDGADTIHAFLTGAPMAVDYAAGTFSVAREELGSITFFAEQADSEVVWVGHPAPADDLVGTFDPASGAWRLGYTEEVAGWKVAVELGGRILGVRR